MKYFTYIARCNDNSLYTGSCKNLENREQKHNKGQGARYTRARLPIKIVYFEEFDTLTDAMKREYQIKRWTKTEKENLVKSSCPEKK
jgi:putative endonuclease